MPEFPELFAARYEIITLFIAHEYIISAYEIATSLVTNIEILSIFFDCETKIYLLHERRCWCYWLWQHQYTV
jgi:hypothetical protein